MATVPSSARSVADFSRSAFAVGSARRRSRAQGYIPGPSAPVPGAVTPEGALVKAAHAIIAGQYNRSVDDAANRAEALAMARQEAQDARAAATEKRLEDAANPDVIEARAAAAARGRQSVQQPDEQFDAPEYLKPFYPNAPKMTAKQIKEYGALHGFDEYGNDRRKRYARIPGVPDEVEVGSELYNAYYGQKAGIRRAPGASGKTVNPFSPVERKAEMDAEGRVKAAYHAAAAKLPQEEFQQTVLSPGTVTPGIAKDPDYIKAADAVKQTRVNNVMNALRRARTAADVAAATERLSVGDPAKKDPRLVKARKDAILRFIPQVQTRAELSTLYDVTADTDDPLNSDPDILRALSDRDDQLPE